ncbi:MAG TPA: long-chain fatty acid--CoA ligase [Candidatus Dormibacteraeota bacterium]|nr:long-chain fatty acid--CoA ligase [Candidatus Dormibacteraeota bacterium]
MSRDVQAEREEINRIVEGRTLLDAFAQTVEHHRTEKALSWKNAEGWQSLNWGEYRDRVRAVALGLRAIGLQPGEFAVIMARNRPEHLIADLGVMHAQGTPVSLYNTLAPEQVQYITGHCEATVAFVEDDGFLQKFRAVRDHLPKLRRIVLLEPSIAADDEWVMSWDQLVQLGRKEDTRDSEAFERGWRQVKPGDLATLIYTSGTTGPPKGVMDTQRQVLWMTEIGHKFLPTRPGERHISYLPFAHAFERYVGHWHAFRWASSVYFCPDPTQLFAYAAEVRPTGMIGVPRVWEKLHAALSAGIAAEPNEHKRAAVQGAIAVGHDIVRHRQSGAPIPAELEAKSKQCQPVWDALRAKVGIDQCEWALTGGAPINTDVIEFFQAIGMRMVEGWGMTETTVCGLFAPSFNLPRNGTVGVAINGVEICAADDGELLVRGGNVTQGYYKDPEKTAETIDGAGWLHTGDIVEIDADGYVKIIDRKKELIITAGGKNISPANLENLLKEHPLVGQACAIGDRRPFVSALIVLDQEVARLWARQHRIEFSSMADLASRHEVVAEVQKAVNDCNSHVAQVESVRKFTILPAEWTPESEELTPTLKLKRRVVLEKYAGEIEAMYSTQTPSARPQKVETG